MSLLTGWIDDARRVYTAYGADLIRTGCFLLRTTPSVAYRAAVLFQRFQAVAEGVRRKRGDYQEEHGFTDGGRSNDQASGTRKASYTVPVHVGTERPSGVLALGDPYAPLDYCLFKLREHDDITYLTAACVLIAAKMEDHSMRIRLIVGVFMRLNQRRRGEPVIEQLQPPPERYDDFKLCMLEAEEVVLQALGFQTFVECPFKYAILFLGMIVEDDNVGVATDAGSTTSHPFYFNGSFSNAAVKRWLADAVCWLNDIPRCVDLYAEEAHVLAVCSSFPRGLRMSLGSRRIGPWLLAWSGQS
ncbi:cyclin L1 [Trypanosoma conorhini]|uniref:Cyclin L1 n=1 Tax=Trypanosoma conorhini TaxID=83891 RepID=A0A3R7PBF0_9TRYP|nr:cyclin L1 [Trypanosoma conorhini]RNF20843.1 cyclin L1 [Trypanosoma conorhini]